MPRSNVRLPASESKKERSKRVQVDRPALEQDQLNQAYNYARPKSTALRNVTDSCREFSPKSYVMNMIPVTGWLPRYRWREYVICDLVSGCTVAVMNIPQGMAYAVLAGVSPIVGIYSAFFPVLVYFLLGTSRHVSMGSFAVVCLLTGKIVMEFQTGVLRAEAEYTPIQVAVAVTFVVGVYQVAMWACRGGVLSSLLSDSLVSGFTTGAAIHVFTSQVRNLLGVPPMRPPETFSLLLTYRHIFRNITSVHLPTMLVSSITLAVLIVNNELIKPWMGRKCKIPIPIELITVVITTLVSYFASLEGTFGIMSVGNIPTGLPFPTLPPFALLPLVALDSVVIMVVSYTVLISMGLILARKGGYKLDPNQEFLALGVGNLVGSFFSCIPYCASLSRSVIQEAVGGKTQLASVFSATLLLGVLLWVGPWFQPLPRCVLASLTVVPLKGMLVQVTQLPQFWRRSPLDGTVWASTFAVVVLVRLDLGLLVGVVLSLGTVLLAGMYPYVCLAGAVPGSEMYLDVDRYAGTVQLPGIKILHYCGSLHFANRVHFGDRVLRLVPGLPEDKTQEEPDDGSPTPPARQQETVVLRFLIVDFSALHYLDPSATDTLHLLAEEFTKADVSLFLAGISGPTYETLKRCDLLDKTPCLFKIFPTVHDAVICAQNYLTEEPN